MTNFKEILDNLFDEFDVTHNDAMVDVTTRGKINERMHALCGDPNTDLGTINMGVMVDKFLNYMTNVNIIKELGVIREATKTKDWDKFKLTTSRLLFMALLRNDYSKFSKTIDMVGCFEFKGKDKKMSAVDIYDDEIYYYLYDLYVEAKNLINEADTLPSVGRKNKFVS